MKAVIVEDEFMAARSLERLIGQLNNDISIVAVLQSVDESVEWFSANPHPDLVYGYSPCRWRPFAIFDKTEIVVP